MLYYQSLMSLAGETFFTSIGCMDGRIHKAVVNYGRKKFGAHYADTITEAGLAGLLTKENVDVTLLKSLKRKIDISVKLHKAKGIVVHGHQECAGNQVPDDLHKKDIRRTLQVIQLMVDPAMPVVGIFVKRHGKSKNSEWEVEEVAFDIMQA